MPIIYTYPQATPKAADLLIGTVIEEQTAANQTKGNPTRSFSISALQSLFSMDYTTVTVSLTDAQVKAAYSAPITLLAAPGANYVLDIERVAIYVDAGTAAFNFSHDLLLKGPWPTANNITVPKTDLINVAADTKAAWVNSPNSNWIMQQNAALILSNANANSANGNGRVYVNITYRSMPLSSSF